MESKEHWEQVYKTKSPQEMSWTQLYPQTSLRLIADLNVSKDASIIDIGGGDSRLVDVLLEEGYTNITVLDISEKSLDKAKARLGEKANQVKWIVSDILHFKPETNYDVWHDRAAFHFLTVEDQIEIYVQLAQRTTNKFLVMGTFSTDGPKKCSGLPVQQYSEESLKILFQDHFEKISCFTENHTTPFDTRQNFLFCSLRKK